MITIVDYGLGNLASIANMLKRVGVASRISSDPVAVREAEKLILPGIGAFDQGILSLRERGLVEVLNARVLQDKIPVLGVCLGMQLLGNRSEEGRESGLGWVAAHTISFRNTPGCERLRIPHMGWNTIKVVNSDPIVEGLPEKQRFYFVHSFHVVCENPADVVATTSYGVDFVSILRHKNVWGAQFHPEKSHKFGMELLRNFAGIA